MAIVRQSKKRDALLALLRNTGQIHFFMINFLQLLKIFAALAQAADDELTAFRRESVLDRAKSGTPCWPCSGTPTPIPRRTRYTRPSSPATPA